MADIFICTGTPFDLAEHDVFDVVDLISLGQIIVAAVVDQPHAANVDGLLADADFAAAHVDVGVAQRGQNLRHGNVVGFQLVRVDRNLKFFGRAAPTVDRGDAGNRQQPPRHDPILHGAQVDDSEMRRAHDLVAIDFAG